MNIFNIDLNLSSKDIIAKLKKDIIVDIDKIFDGYNLKDEYKLGRYLNDDFIVDSSITYKDFFDKLALEVEDDLISYVKDVNRLNYILGEDRYLSILESNSSILLWPIYSLLKKSPKYIDLYIESYSYVDRYYNEDFIIIEKFIEENYSNHENFLDYVFARIFGSLSHDRCLYEGFDQKAMNLIKYINIDGNIYKISDKIYENYISLDNDYFYPSKRKNLKNSLEKLDFKKVFSKYNRYSKTNINNETILKIKETILKKDYTFRTKLEDIDEISQFNKNIYETIFEELREKNIIQVQTGLGDVLNYGKILVNNNEIFIANLDGDIYLISDKKNTQEVKLLHEGDYEDISVAEEIGGLADYISYEWYDKVEVFSLSKGKMFEINKDFRNVYLGSKGNYIYFETFETPDKLEVYSIKEKRFFESIKIKNEDFEKANIYFANGRIIITFHKDYIEAWINIYSAKGELLISDWRLDTLDNLYKKNFSGDEMLLCNKIYDLNNKKVIGALEGSIQEYYIKVEDRYFGLCDKKLTVYKHDGSIDKFYDLDVDAWIEDIEVRRNGLIIDLYLNNKELHTFILNNEKTNYEIIEE